jgi:hypothetical protein
MASNGKVEQNFHVEDILDVPCRVPPFRGQEVKNEHGVYRMDEENSIVLLHDVLSPSEIKKYLTEASKVPRQSGRSGFGLKPRKEICYTPSGQPYVYSKISHRTIRYPLHVMEVLAIIEPQVDEAITLTETSPSNEYVELSSGVDIVYDSSFPRGGSIAAHSDDEDNWGLVVIFSLGQTRYLRVRSLETKQWCNIEMPHNSVVVMHGPSFQKRYTHQVDKLHKDEPVYTRLSLNVRYKRK